MINAWQRKFMVSSIRVRGPAMAGRTNQACWDTRPGPGAAMGPGAGGRDLSWRTARWIRRRARGKAGRSCVTLGPYSSELSMLPDPGQKAVSLRPRSTCQSVVGLGSGRRFGPESGKDDESGQVRVSLAGYGEARSDIYGSAHCGQAAFGGAVAPSSLKTVAAG